MITSLIHSLICSTVKKSFHINIFINCFLSQADKNCKQPEVNCVYMFNPFTPEGAKSKIDRFSKIINNYFNFSSLTESANARSDGISFTRTKKTNKLTMLDCARQRTHSDLHLVPPPLRNLDRMALCRLIVYFVAREIPCEKRSNDR